MVTRCRSRKTRRLLQHWQSVTVVKSRCSMFRSRWQMFNMRKVISGWRAVSMSQRSQALVAFYEMTRRRQRTHMETGNLKGFARDCLPRCLSYSVCCAVIQAWKHFLVWRVSEVVALQRSTELWQAAILSGAQDWAIGRILTRFLRSSEPSTRYKLVVG